MPMPMPMPTKDATLKLLEELTQAHGAPGGEGPVRAIFQRELKRWPLTQDGMGGAICTLPSKVDGPRVVVTAHFDEVGFMVQHITEEGFLRFIALGGWWTHNLLSQRVRVRTRSGDEILGVVATIPPHLMSQNQQERLMPIEKLAIDVGARDWSEAEETFGIRLGDPIVPESPLVRMQNPDLLLSKAFDNRVGVALMIQVLQQAAQEGTPNTLVGVGTVQEEMGMRGARPAANTVDADVALVLEGPPADDSPGFARADAQGRLGGGVQIRVMDASAIMHRELVDWVRDVAEETGIPHQVTVRRAGGTDAAPFQTAAGGAPVVVLGVPARYIHTHNAIIDINDYVAARGLVMELVRRLDADQVARIRSS
jgi:endoglucanase